MIAIGLLLILLNGGISFVNALGCAYSDAETKAVGGWQRFVWWCGWLMSALGFSSCYFLICVAVGYGFGLVTSDNIGFVSSFWYVLAAPPWVGICFVLTAHSWAVTFRNGGFLNWSTSVWNTYATIHNTMGLIENFGGALEEVFRGLRKLGDSKEGAKLIALIILVLFTIGAGFLTTWAIVRKFSANYKLPDREEFLRRQQANQR